MRFYYRGQLSSSKKLQARSFHTLSLINYKTESKNSGGDRVR